MCSIELHLSGTMALFEKKLTAQVPSTCIISTKPPTRLHIYYPYYGHDHGRSMSSGRDGKIMPLPYASSHVFTTTLNDDDVKDMRYGKLKLLIARALQMPSSMTTDSSALSSYTLAHYHGGKTDDDSLRVITNDQHMWVSFTPGSDIWVAVKPHTGTSTAASTTTSTTTRT
jgi:hypothetical protein